MASVLLEAKPYRPFKSSEEYLEAMKEDLAEWLNMMYPELDINAENFMNRLDTGVALCIHANNVRKAAEEYIAKRQARQKSMTRSMTSGLAGPILANLNVHYLPSAKSGTFFARDNVSNFITWCRQSLKIFECLLFETDDLIMRKNEKHVILCLLEVARRGAKFGMLAPMLVQMERQIDREIAADNKANAINQTETTIINQKTVKTEEIFETDSEEEEDDEEPVLFYGPQPQIITNDLKSLDEMVRDLVEQCTCPSQFPMVRVSEGKYRIGDTKVLIFVRILRSHVMVRVGGGWDTLSHYLDKHDPCRCRSAHRTSVAARLIPRTSNQNNGIELHKAQVIYERSPPPARKAFAINTFGSPILHSPQSISNVTPNALSGIHTRSRSPTPQKKYLNQQNQYTNGSSSLTTSPISTFNRRSMSPSPRRLTDIRKKQCPNDTSNQSKLANEPINTTTSVGITTPTTIYNNIQNDNLSQPKETTVSPSNNCMTIVNLCSNSIENSSKFDNVSDNGSEISDEGYRSLGIQQINNHKCESQPSTLTDEADYSGMPYQNSINDGHSSPGENTGTKPIEIMNSTESSTEIDTPTLSPSPRTKSFSKTNLDNQNIKNCNNIFEQSGIFITDDDITVDIAGATGLRKTGFSNKIYGGDETSYDLTAKFEEKIVEIENRPDTNSIKSGLPCGSSKIPRSPKITRRRSVDVLNEKNQQEPRINSSPYFSRKQPEYRSARSARELASQEKQLNNLRLNRSSSQTNATTNTWNGRNKKKPHPTLNEHPIRSSSLNSHLDNNKQIKKPNTHILYDSHGRRVNSKSTSLTTSPVKSKSSVSPLAQQLLKVANNAKNDAQMLEKMKQILQQYGKDTSPIKKPTNNDNVGSYTSEWVHNNGELERSGSSSSSSTEYIKTKALNRTNSATSSVDISCKDKIKEIPSATLIPKSRYDHRGLSKIPAPIRRNTELY